MNMTSAAIRILDVDGQNNMRQTADDHNRVSCIQMCQFQYYAAVNWYSNFEVVSPPAQQPIVCTLFPVKHRMPVS